MTTNKLWKIVKIANILHNVSEIMHNSAIFGTNSGLPVLKNLSFSKSRMYTAHLSSYIYIRYVAGLSYLCNPETTLTNIRSRNPEGLSGLKIERLTEKVWITDRFVGRLTTVACHRKGNGKSFNVDFLFLNLYEQPHFVQI